jgi:hypothetical protein
MNEQRAANSWPPWERHPEAGITTYLPREEQLHCKAVGTLGEFLPARTSKCEGAIVGPEPILQG